MSVKSSLALILILPFLAGCKTDTAEKGTILHPTIINKKPLQPVNHVITNQRSGSWTDSTDLELVTSIGKSSGEREYMIGKITDIGLRDDEVILLDGQSNNLRSYDIQTGKFIQDFSGPGRGPGDIMYPMKLAMNESLIFISDRLLKTEIFKFENGQYENYDQLSLDFSAYGICTIDNFLFISGYNYKINKQTVHKYDLVTKKKVKSFHPPYKSDNPLIKALLSGNSVSCNSSSQTIIVTPKYLPFIYGYNLNGEIKWVSELSEYYYRRIVEEVDNQGRLKTLSKGANHEGYTDFWRGFTPIGSTAFQFFQINRIRLHDKEVTDSSILTYLLNTNNGQTEFISDNLPEIKSANVDHLVSYTLSAGYPEIKIFKTFLR